MYNVDGGERGSGTPVWLLYIGFWSHRQMICIIELVGWLWWSSVITALVLVLVLSPDLR